MNLPSKQNLQELKNFIEERQRIYLKKEAGEPWPWTEDPILQKFSFCNIYREQDKVTKWIRENWREPYKDDQNLWFAMAIARQINWPPTLQAIGYPVKWEPKKVLNIMQERAKRGEQNYSSAYMLTAGGHPGKDKPTITVMHALDPLYQVAMRQQPLWEFADSLENTWKWFIKNKLYGFGPFISYEVVTDLRHTRYLRNATDVYSWANPGPGCKRGLNRLYGMEVDHLAPVSTYIEKMQGILRWLVEHTDIIIVPTFEMRDVEHICCEYFKYIRAKEAIKNGTRCSNDLYRPSVPTVTRLF